MNNVFAIVVTWNGEDCIATCIHSLLNTDIPMQVLVVDNASSDNTVKIVQDICPRAIVFRLTENRGFGKANNIGIKYAYDHGAEHFLLINQDAYVDVNTVRNLVKLQQSNPESAIISPLHLDGTGQRLDHLFANHIGRSANIRELMTDVLLKRQVADIYHVGFINAAIWLLSRDCITRVGLFNPAFDHYWEDNEYTDRVHFQGLNVSLAPACHAYHGRAQDVGPEKLTLTRYRLIVNAAAQYRILRRFPGASSNIASAISLILFSSPPINTSFMQAIMVKLDLVRRLLSTLQAMLHYRKRAYQGSQCFFDDAELDRQRYVLS